MAREKKCSLLPLSSTIRRLPLGQMLYPALSTVDLDYGLLADAAIRFILKREEKFTPERTLIKPRLLIRESTLEKSWT